MSKRIEYETHNYSAYNEAVGHELEHHREIAAAVHEESRLRRAKVWVLIALAVAILALTISLIVWLFSGPRPDALSVFSSKDTSQDLGSIARAQDQKEIGVTTRFNVFDKSPMATGEIVVTSKEYTPDDLVEPLYQYCYVTNSTEISNATQTLIADVELGEVRLKTQDPFLIDNALPLCTFKRQAQ